MKRTLMVSVAALALAAGSTIAMSQGNSGRGEGGASGQMNESPAPGRGAQDRALPEKQQKAQQAPSAPQAPNARQTQGEREQAPTTKQSQGEQDKSGTTTRQSQGERDKSAPTTRQSQGEREKSGTQTQQQTQSPSTGGAKQGTAGTQSGAMRTSNVSLTTEQKTTIRSKVLTSSAPRVTNVNFDIRIGTVVPRTVRIAPVPVTLVEIEPTWRGYMYFVYADEIIIVEPRTLEIVYVLAV